MKVNAVLDSMWKHRSLACMAVLYMGNIRIKYKSQSMPIRVVFSFVEALQRSGACHPAYFPSELIVTAHYYKSNILADTIDF